MMRRIWLLAAVVLMLGQFGISMAQDEAKPKKLNPYTGNPEAAAEGRKVYFLYACNACHGGTGGGGMAGAPALFDDEWNYGSDDGTLFKVIRGQIPDQIMPPVGLNMKEEEIWKVLAWIRTLYKGDPNLVNW
ncbi:MAG: cytochrome c [Candidatus Methylomirabilales bacterium]